MSDVELRNMLLEAIKDMDEGRVPVRPPRRYSVRRLLTVPLVAASVGLAACGGRNVGALDDATVPRDAAVSDAEVDSGPVDLYGLILEDGGPTWADAAYMAPFDSGPEPPYMAPFDASADGEVDEIDAGNIPLYMGPPPDDP